MAGKKKKKSVTDPVRDAEERFGCPFEQKRTEAPWRAQMSRYTTGRFARLGKGYKRHCGPTAITNLLLTLNSRYGFLEDPDPTEIFTEVSRIGRKYGIYRNTDILGHFGGTYDLLTYPYLRACFRRFRVPDSIQTRAYPLASEAQFLREIQAGKILYLQLLYHPVYGNHHLLCYGYTVVRSEDRKRREIYLLLADGWSTPVRYMRLKSRGICHFVAVG